MTIVLTDTSIAKHTYNLPLHRYTKHSNVTDFVNKIR